MIPENVLASTARFAPFAFPTRAQAELLRDYELAGINLRDGTKGMSVKTWTVSVVANTQIWLSAPGSGATMLFDRGVNILEVALAFDNNMNPFVAFREGLIGTVGSSFKYWFDSSDNTQKTTALPAGIRSLRCCIDERRSEQTAVSDVCFSYIRNNNLYVLYTRERYEVEHLLQSNLGNNAEIVAMGLNRSWRMQWHMKNTNAIPGAAVFESPKLGDIVRQLCSRVGIQPQEINVSELYETEVIGYKVNTKDGINARIDALRKLFFFDKSEGDRMISFPRRGRQVIARIPYEDLVADQPSSLSVTRVQESELPLTVSVTHLDPAGGFSQNKQTARRRSNLVKAKGERTIESEVVLTADQAATTAIIESKVSWWELLKYKFKTTAKYSFVLPTDVVEVQDEKGGWHIVRVKERNDDKAVISFEGNLDGQEIYGSLGVGNSLPPPVSTTPGVIGPTRDEILNIPCLRDQDDELGVYMAFAGESSAWYGTQVMISTDDGVNYQDAMTVETPATLGDLLTPLLAETSAEYPSDQSFEVLVNFPLESVTRESLLTNINRCVVGDEVLQFQFAVLVGMVDGKYHYRCSGLIRGRYATLPEAWAIGTRFVMIDSSIVFMQAQQWMLGRSLYVKAVSLGQTEDETAATEYDYDEGVSQREFPVLSVKAVRTGSDVTVTFIGRGRLGIETAPRNGKYFAGYRLKFSNGQTFDTYNQAHTYTGAPTGITVQVCALNTVTGEGPYSTPIPT